VQREFDAVGEDAGDFHGKERAGEVAEREARLAGLRGIGEWLSKCL
jgi:hypothetical protein